MSKLSEEHAEDDAMLLVLVMIGAFIPAAQAVYCYACDRTECGDTFTDSTVSCTGEVCSEEIVETKGWFTMHLFKLLLIIIIIIIIIITSISNAP